MIKFLKSIFYISVLFLITISLYPGSLLGYLLYSDWGQQPNLILDSKKEKKEQKEQIFEKKVLKDRKFVLSNLDEKKHEEFIKKIKNPMWNEYK